MDFDKSGVRITEDVAVGAVTDTGEGATQDQRAGTEDQGRSPLCKDLFSTGDDGKSSLSKEF